MRASPRLPSPLSVALALGVAAQAALAPIGVLAKVPDVHPELTPFPEKMSTEFNVAFVTAGDYIAFDYAFTNTSGSNLAHVTLGATIDGPAPSYQGTFKKSGTLIGQTTCSPASSGAFACDVGNAPADSTLNLRIVYLTSSTPGDLTVTVSASTSGTSDNDGGTSHGDSFLSSASVKTLAPFVDTGDDGTSGYLPPTGDDLQTSPANFGTANPMWTHVNVPAAAMGNLPFGEAAFLEESNGFEGIDCPAAFGCFGQTSHLVVAGGATMAAPFSVEIELNNAKAFTNLNRWTIVHIDEDGTNPTEITRECDTTAGPPTNAPCIQSKAVSSTDRTDYIALVWLLKNGYIKTH